VENFCIHASKNERITVLSLVILKTFKGKFVMLKDLKIFEKVDLGHGIELVRELFAFAKVLNQK
jgi:hypothetical protein